MAPVASSEPDNDCATFMPQNCDPSHEFDWAIPYIDAFERHGIGYLTEREGIPLMEAVSVACDGRQSEFWEIVTLSPAEYEKVIEAAGDVCLEVLR